MHIFKGRARLSYRYDHHIPHRTSISISHRLMETTDVERDISFSQVKRGRPLSRTQRPTNVEWRRRIQLFPLVPSIPSVFILIRTPFLFFFFLLLAMDRRDKVSSTRPFRMSPAGFLLLLVGRHRYRQVISAVEDAHSNPTHLQTSLHTQKKKHRGRSTKVRS